MEEIVIRRRVVVRGHVQGVFFRDSSRAQARRHQVTGWVTNRADGAVEAVFEGDEAAVDAMVAWAHHGPESAVVTGVEVVAEAPEGLPDFRIR
ncbi:MAG TPA: acylphosphatase [Propionibacteriaceae bacterium]|nr:acylphosphatase [Propionibacteriaceae bacterium]